MSLENLADFRTFHRNNLSLKGRKAYWEEDVDHWSNGRHFLHVEKPEQKESIDSVLTPYLEEMRKSGSTVVDLGSAGTSDVYLTPALMSQVTAVDFSKPALLANPAKHKVQADISEVLPFQDQSFNYATLFFVNRYLDNQLSVFKNVYRLLVPGGRFIAIDFTCNDIGVEVSEFKPRELIPTLGSIGYTELETTQLMPEVDFRDEFSYYRGPLHVLTGQRN